MVHNPHFDLQSTKRVQYMIRDRLRIAAKLGRIQDYLENRHPVEWEAVNVVDRLRRDAIYTPTWQWEGFASEIEWARARY
jgi:hypothetical protein